MLFSVADLFSCLRHCLLVQQLVRLNLVPLSFPTDSHEALLGPMTYPSGVQVGVDVHAVHPSGHTSV